MEPAPHPMPRRPRRRPPAPLIGPLAGWELVRLARRGQGHRGRLLVGYLLLIAFVLTAVFWFERTDPIGLFTGPGRDLPAPDAARFGRGLVLVLFQAVLFAVAAMTPAYAASAVADEKERQTLPLLLTTALSDREIVLGKAVGRLVFVLGAAAAAVPVLTATRLIAPVDGGFLLAGCGLLAGTAVLCTAIGVHAACAQPDLRAALLRAYGVTAVLVCGAFVPPCVVASPFGVLVWLQQSNAGLLKTLLVAVAYPVVQVLIAVGFFRDAIRQVRKPDPVARPAPRVVVTPVPPKPAADVPVNGWDPEPDPPYRVEVLPPGTPARPPIADTNPLLWKERYASGRRAGPNDPGRLVPVLLGVLGALLLFIGGRLLVLRALEPSVEPDEGGRLVMTGGTVLAGVYLFPAAVGLASAVARERRRNTLESLLSLPLDRRFVLRTKVRAAVERGWWWAPVAVGAAGVSFAADGGWRLGLAAAGFVLAAGAFVIGLGAYLTVRSPSEVRAFRFVIPAVVLAVGAPVGVWNATDWVQPVWSEAGLGAGAAALAASAAVCWWLAGRALDRLI